MDAYKYGKSSNVPYNESRLSAKFSTTNST